MKKFWLDMISSLKNGITYNTDWAEEIGKYELDYQKVGEEFYGELLDTIRKAADGAFDVASPAVCRKSQERAICQKRELPWGYLYDCMKLSRKDFCIFLPDKIANQLLKHIVEDNKTVYAWYDSETDSIRTFAYTGNMEDEENTYPAYDGYGRYDTYYEIVEGYVNKEGEWLKEPKLRFISLYLL